MKKKKLKKHIIFLILVTGLLQGCAVIKDVQHYKTDSIHKNDFSKCNGSYSNIHTDTTVVSYNRNYGFEYDPKTLWSHTYSYNNDKEKGNSKQQAVKLEFKNRRKIFLLLYEKDSLIGNRTIRGRIRSGFFYSKPHLTIIPLIPLVVSYNTYRYRIGFSTNFIVIDYSWRFWGFALIAGGWGNGQTSTTFKKL